MNVLQIMGFGTARKGNFINSILALDDQLRKRGGRVIYLFPQRAAVREWAKEIAIEKDVYFMPDNLLKSEILMRKIIKKHKIDIVHSHFIGYESYVPLKIASFAKGIPHIFHAHSMPQFGRSILKKWLVNAKLVIGVSEAVCEKYKNLGFECICVKNGIDFSRLEESTACPEIASRSPSALMFGYDTKIKGVDTAVKALLEHDKNHEITLCICVSNNLERVREEIKAIAGEIPSWIILLPPRDDVASYYNAADVFLSASRFEGLPYAVCEAAYLSLPLVLSDIPPHCELAIPGSMFFEAENKQSLYLSLKEAVNKKGREEAKEYIEEGFSMEKWTDTIVEIYDKI